MAEGIRVNMSDQEAKSEDREPLPAGKYHFKITDFDIAFVKDVDGSGNPNKNAGKPYINLEFTCQDGRYAGRKDWTNAMCFDGALYTISQILKALDYKGVTVGPDGSAKGGELVIPDKREFYVGKDIWGRRGTNNKDKNPDGTLRVQLRGFAKYEGGTSEVTGKPGVPGAKATAGAGAGASVLP